MTKRAFTKLFSSILDSSIWSEKDSTRIAWLTLLAMSDADGFVDASIPGLATRARLTIEQVEEALERFRAPDRYSRTTEHEGRRIVDVPGGWHLLNYARYRRIAIEEVAKESKRDYAARMRAAKASNDVGEGTSKTDDVESVEKKSNLPSASASENSYLEKDPDLPYMLGTRAGAHAVKEASAVDDEPPPSKPSTFAPRSFAPNESHQVRCQELKLPIADLVRAFKDHEFNRTYTDWDRRFSAWIEKERILAEVERSKAVSGAGRGPRIDYGRSPLNPLGWAPNAKHEAFAKSRGLDLHRYARSYIMAGGATNRSIADANRDFGLRLIRVAKGEPFGLELVAA